MINHPPLCKKLKMDILDSLLDQAESSQTVTKVDEVALLKSTDEFLDFVLLSAHNHPDKHKKMGLSKRVNFACPYCGDSKRDNSKKRGNIYTSSLWFKCYNHPCVTKPLIAMVKDFQGERFFSSDQLSFLEHSSHIDIKSGGVFTSNKSVGSLSEFLDVQKYGISRIDLMNTMGLLEIDQCKFAADYVAMRLMTPSIWGDTNHLLCDPMDRSIVMLNLDSSRQLVMGLQKRFVDADKGDFRFRSYTYEQILEDFWFVNPDTIDPTIKKLISKSTLLFNFFITNFNAPILILESGIDATHIPNSLGLLSAGTSINIKKNGYYMYDNSMIDNAGNDAATSRIISGFNVFLWRKFIKEWPIFKSCKDLNDMWKIKGGMIIDMGFLLPYFSNDQLSILDI